MFGNFNYIINLLILSFYAVTFLESGIDKVFQKDGNLGWFREHFSKSIIKPIITPLFYWMTIQEIIVGLFAIISMIAIIRGNFFYGNISILSGLFVFIQLYTGQRLAKDYVGASGIVNYIVLSLVSIVLYNL